MTKVRITLKLNDCHAEAEYDPDTNVTTILTGSQWAQQKNSIPNSVIDWRDQIKKNGVVDVNGKFAKNQPIVTRREGRTSLSLAAGIITGRAAQGTKEWVVCEEKRKDIAIGDYLKDLGVLDADGHFIQLVNRKQGNNS